MFDGICKAARAAGPDNMAYWLIFKSGPAESPLFARKIHVQVMEAGEGRACPLAWLDSYSMRSFTGRSAFDETLPVSDGVLETSLRVDLDALRADMEDWMTRKFGEGKAVKLRFEEQRGKE